MIILSSLFGLYLPLVLRQVIDGQEGLNIGKIARIIGIFLAQAILLSAGHYLMARSGEDLVADKRKGVSRHLIYSPVAFFNYQKSGDLSSRIVNDTTSIGKFYTSQLPSLIASLVTIVGTVTILFILDWRLSLTFLVSLPLLGVIVVPISAANHKVSQLLQEDISLLTGDLTESFKEIELIKANGAEKHRLTVLENRISKIRKSALKADLMEAVASPFVLLVMFGSIALIFTYGGQRVALGSLTIGTLISFLIYLFQLLNPVGVVSSIANEFAKMKGATKQVDELLEHEQEKFGIGDNNLMIGQVTFEQVSFAYQSEQPVLSTINFTLPKGKKIAFVGPSGSGTTTLINLLERFYPVTSGKICLDGRNIEEFDLSAWRSQLALVSQANAVLSGTIRENLLFGL
jgi:ATP-binding cassette subfamily B protein AbcA/BmrA